jgi:hypothetical protein
MVCDHVIDSISSIDLPVMLPAHCAERIHNTLVQDVQVNYCVHDVLIPVPQIATFSIHSDGVFDGGGLASVLGFVSDSANDNGNDNDVYDNVHDVHIVSVDVDNITNGACNSHLCNFNIAHVRVSDLAHDAQCDIACIEPVPHTDVSYSKVHGVTNVTVSDFF